MTQQQSRLTSFIFWVLCFLVTGYFTIHGLGLGNDKGYLSFAKLNHDIDTATVELAELRAHRAWLEHRVSLVAEDEVDADLLGEIARERGGLFAPNELIIELN